MEKVLLNLKETCEYLGLGMTKTRELFKSCTWSLKIGNKWYANRVLLDKWLVQKCKVCKTA